MFGSKVKVNVKSFLAPGLSEKLLSEKEYVKWFMKSWFASNVKVTMAGSSPVLPTIAVACKVLGCQIWEPSLGICLSVLNSPRFPRNHFFKEVLKTSC